MKSIDLAVLVLAVGLCVSCGGGRKGSTAAGTDTATEAAGVPAPVDGNGLVTIDLSADYPEQEISLQSIADVEYVPLAISDKVLLSASDQIFYLSDRYITVYGQGGIFVFNRDGSIASHFNRQGRGPGEYLRFWDVVFDEAAQEFFVLNGIPPSSGILVYSLDGTHKRTLPLPEKWLSKTLWSVDAETLLVFEENGTYDDNLSATPYHLISKSDGSVVETLDIRMPRRYSEMSFMELTGPDGQKNRQPVQLSTGGNKRFGGNEITIADISSDTLYHFSHERALTPVLVRTPSVHASEPRTVWTAHLITERFIVFAITTFDFEGAIKNGTYPVRELMYNFKTGRLAVPDFINADTSEGWSAGTYETQAPVNWAVDMLDPLRLVEAREKGELSGRLDEIAAKIKEDDNPVVMIVKFK